MNRTRTAKAETGGRKDVLVGQTCAKYGTPKIATNRMKEEARLLRRIGI